jgi:hypothetical protein
MSEMSVISIIVVVAVGFLIFKFVVKPLFKLAGFVILALLAWWLLSGTNF